MARGAQLKEGLLRLQKRFPISDIRGPGLMVGMEVDGPEGTLQFRIMDLL